MARWKRPISLERSVVDWLRGANRFHFSAVESRCLLPCLKSQSRMMANDEARVTLQIAKAPEGKQPIKPKDVLLVPFYDSSMKQLLRSMLRHRFVDIRMCFLMLDILLTALTQKYDLCNDNGFSRSAHKGTFQADRVVYCKISLEREQWG